MFLFSRSSFCGISFLWLAAFGLLSGGVDGMAGDGGPMPSDGAARGPRDARWLKVTSPTVEYENDQSAGGRLFAQAVPDMTRYVHDIARRVGRMLYHDPAEVPAFERLTLRIFKFDGIAWKSGEPPHITVAVSTDYLLRYHEGGGDVAEEVRGILYHEMTHAYQHAEGMSSFAVEGIADVVRHRAGYIPNHFREPGGHWSDGYKTTAFFFAWIQEERGFDDFTYVLNQSAHPKNRGFWSWEDTITNATCHSVHTLWDEYQSWLSERP
ncbi:Peptidase of plants and bacteria [Sulfidibacter corallicola]|uniref:Peptidase n=1 Tax=Sulfidibacter corallicola TaxID=2818388 RepID=A0A8A4TC14_SULCO|nr:basic secretory family protein [Sulfidibacter corallicola]QTD47649.1 hypothetical protein J3U87_18815 [Sulfidibacter corallicola]